MAFECPLMTFPVSGVLPSDTTLILSSPGVVLDAIPTWLLMIILLVSRFQSSVLVPPSAPRMVIEQVRCPVHESLPAVFMYFPVDPSGIDNIREYEPAG